MHDSMWKYEYEVEHERLLKCQAETEKLREAYKEYIKLLEDELHGLAGFLLAHGIKSSRVEAGKKARAKIQALKENKP